MPLRFTRYRSALLIFQTALIIGCAGSVPRGSVSSTQNPQVARYTITPPSGAAVTVDFGTDTSYPLHTSAVPAHADGSPVSILVAGMRAFTSYHMRARMTMPDNSEVLDVDHIFSTGGVPPERIPQVTVTHPVGMEPQPGIELLDLFFVGHVSSNSRLTAAAFDLDGNLIWFDDLQDGGGLDSPFPIKLLPNGNFLLVVSGGSNEVREVNLAGETITRFAFTDLNVPLLQAGFPILGVPPNSPLPPLHHDILPLPNGHLILIGSTVKTFANLPGFAGDTEVLGDVLIDLDENRIPVWHWSTFDHLDVNRHPLSFPDWTHSNAVIYSPDDGNLIFSMRDQDWVVKINYENGRGDGSILWRLGPGGDFTIPGGGPADFNYAQHYPALTTAKSSGVFPLIMFDNGNNRILDSAGTICGTPGAPACSSRPVLFELDEVAKTARILWQDKLPAFSLCCGSIGILANGNVEYDIAIDSVSGPLTNSRIQEVTQELNPQLVWQMDVKGQLAYRGFRMPSLYPGVQWDIKPSH